MSIEEISSSEISSVCLVGGYMQCFFPDPFPCPYPLPSDYDGNIKPLPIVLPIKPPPPPCIGVR
jgi:hypothetical protein